ncbi:hypothetical protein COCON_G00175150, partial [Conger conger]
MPPAQKEGVATGLCGAGPRCRHLQEARGPLGEGGGRRAEQRSEPGEEPAMTSCYGVDIPPPMTPPMTPPLPSASPKAQPLPAPTPMYTLPWHVPYPATIVTPFMSTASADWRGHSAGGGDTLDLSWSRALNLQHTGMAVPYRTQFPTDSPDVFTCLPPGQRNYNSHNPQITHAQHFPRPPTYAREPPLRDKTGLSARRPNGFDRRDGWNSLVGKSSDRQGNGRPGWGTPESPRCEGKRSSHEYRQPPAQAFSEDATD